jgi:hypothetical protein
MGKPGYLDEDQIRSLHVSARPTVVRDEILHSQGRMEWTDTIQANGILYYSLEKIG